SGVLRRCLRSAHQRYQYTCSTSGWEDSNNGTCACNHAHASALGTRLATFSFSIVLKNWIWCSNAPGLSTAGAARRDPNVATETQTIAPTRSHREKRVTDDNASPQEVVALGERGRENEGSMLEKRRTRGRIAARRVKLSR